MDNSNDFKRQEDNKGALVNTNNQALEMYKKTKQRMQRINKIDQLEEKVDKLTLLIETLLEKNK